MLRTLVCAGVTALLLCGAAPAPSLSVTSTATASPVSQSRVDDCFDDCVVICMQHSGATQTACQFECMMVTCLANPPMPGVTKAPVATRRE